MIGMRNNFRLFARWLDFLFLVKATTPASMNEHTLVSMESKREEKGTGGALLSLRDGIKLYGASDWRVRMTSRRIVRCEITIGWADNLDRATMPVSGRETRSSKQLHPSRGVGAHWNRISIILAILLVLPIRPCVLISINWRLQDKKETWVGEVWLEHLPGYYVPWCARKRNAREEHEEGPRAASIKWDKFKLSPIHSVVSQMHACCCCFSVQS